MMQVKILILDDKASGDDFSTSQALSKLSHRERSLIDNYENTESLWAESSDNDDIELLTDFSNYPFIFIHDSFENSLLRDGLKPVLFEKLSKTSKVVLFSGSRSESEVPVERIYDEQISKHTSCYEILRRQYFNNLKNFINSYFVIGEFKIKYLYNPYISPTKDKAYILLQIIKTKLEESVQCAIESNSFNDLISLYGYEESFKISERFSKMTDDEIIERLEDLIENT